MGKAHRATGNPRGRPWSVPFDLCKRICDVLERRISPETGLVKPNWKGLARELGVSRSTIARRMAELHDSGVLESVDVEVGPNSFDVYYRLSKAAQKG